METIPVPASLDTRALWLQTQPTEDLMFMLGAIATAIGRNLDMSEVEVYERAAVEARKDSVLQDSRPS